MTSAELTIAEVAERIGLTRHTLRYYERDGLMLGVDRAGSGHRRYSERDLSWLELITKLRATGMPIREVRRYAEMVRAGEGNEAERLALLRAHRARVRAQLDLVTDAAAGAPPSEQRLALAALRPVHVEQVVVRGVDKVPARRDVPVQDRKRRRFVGPRAEPHRAKAQDADLARRGGVISDGRVSHAPTLAVRARSKSNPAVPSSRSRPVGP